tara:strand:+ start:403369 stop:404553 length:1185 start_codon:yes stop_codon:yes gene_type:complete
MRANGINRGTVPTLTILVAMTAFSIDVSLPAFPAISEALDVPSGSTHLIISAYFVSYALAQLPLGLLSERLGRLPVLYGGLTIFIIGGLIATYAESLTMLLLGRFIQGIGGGAGPVLSRTIARDISSGAQLGRMMSLLVSALAVSTIVGPIIGSLLVAWLDWSSTMAASVVLGLVCLPLVYCFVPETRGMNTLDTGNFLDHCKTFLRHRTAVVCSIMVALLFFGYMSFIASFSTIVADQFGRPPAEIGWYFAFFVCFYLLGASASRHLNGGKNNARLMDAAFVLMMTSVLLFALTYLDVAPVTAGLAGGMICFLLAKGCMFGLLSARVLTDLPGISGTASGIMGTMQVFAGFAGSATSAAIYHGDASSTVLILSTASVVMTLIYFWNRAAINTA